MSLLEQGSEPYDSKNSEQRSQKGWVALLASEF